MSLSWFTSKSWPCPSPEKYFLPLSCCMLLPNSSSSKLLCVLWTNIALFYHRVLAHNKHGYLLSNFFSSFLLILQAAKFLSFIRSHNSLFSLHPTYHLISLIPIKIIFVQYLIILVWWRDRKPYLFHSLLCSYHLA